MKEVEKEEGWSSSIPCITLRLGYKLSPVGLPTPKELAGEASMFFPHTCDFRVLGILVEI